MTIRAKPWRTIYKPWGREEIWEGEHYTIKRLYVLPLSSLSRQYHRAKHETMVLISGHAWLNDQPMEPGLVYDIPPMTEHRLVNRQHSQKATYAVVLEVSHGPQDDTVRLEDDYGRD